MSLPIPGTSFAGHRIEREIGRGGFGVVYVGEHLRLKQKRAIKVLSEQFSIDDSFRRRFDRECRLAAALDHPNIIPIYEAGEENGLLYVVMRYVAGGDLQSILMQRGASDAKEFVRIVEHVATALDAAHQAGLVHRDVKLANILVRHW